MIEAVSGSQVCNPAGQAQSAGGDLFSQMFASLIAGLAPGACPSPAGSAGVQECAAEGEVPEPKYAAQPDGEAKKTESDNALAAAALVPVALVPVALVPAVLVPVPCRTNEVVASIESEGSALCSGAAETIAASAVNTDTEMDDDLNATDQTESAATSINTPLELSYLLLSGSSGILGLQEQAISGEKPYRTHGNETEQKPANPISDNAVFPNPPAEFACESEVPSQELIPAVPAAPETAGKEAAALRTAERKHHSGVAAELMTAVAQKDEADTAKPAPLTVKDKEASMQDVHKNPLPEESGMERAEAATKPQLNRQQPSGEAMENGTASGERRKESQNAKLLDHTFQFRVTEQNTAAVEMKIYSKAYDVQTTPAHTSPSISAEGIEKLVESAKRLEAGSGRLSLEINDAGIGKVQVEMKMKSGVIDINLRVENGETGRILSAKAPELVDALAQRGISGGVQVFSGTAGDGSSRQGGGSRDGFQGRARVVEEEELTHDTDVLHEGRLSLYA